MTRVNNGMLLLLVLALVYSVSVSGMDPRHYEYQGCNCQCGGERGGHCHCPYDRRMNNVYCRDGGNHLICFPFENVRCWFPCCA